MDAFHPQGHPAGGHGHELFEANMRPLLIFVAVMVVVAVVVQVALAGMMNFYASEETPAAALPSLAPPPERNKTPAPPLQGDPHADLILMRDSERAELDDYGWADRKAGVVRIPIAEAMDLVARRGLPARESRKTMHPKSGSEAGSKPGAKPEETK